MVLNFPQDCDNAPKRRVIRDFIIAFYKKEIDLVEKKIEEKFEFRIIGSKTIDSRIHLQKYLYSRADIIELSLDEILSHGKFAACNGVYKTKNSEINFAYFFEFKSAGKDTIKIISEYIIRNI